MLSLLFYLSWGIYWFANHLALHYLLLGFLPIWILNGIIDRALWEKDYFSLGYIKVPRFGPRSKGQVPSPPPATQPTPKRATPRTIARNTKQDVAAIRAVEADARKALKTQRKRILREAQKRTRKDPLSFLENPSDLFR
jgi:hypothetical protein